jgi:hypothetical protein
VAEVFEARALLLLAAAPALQVDLGAVARGVLFRLGDARA